ncbi:hypothetical protein DW094_13845 [Ruminococcaceae bacterium AM07-15]|nr:hypothetical protein DW094_13845 [Ruminococcaceae bacterium AM07-15]
MKKFFARLGFRKMDEMEQMIAFKAQRNAYGFLILALLVWTVWEGWGAFPTQSKAGPLAGFLLVAAVLVQMLSQFVMERNAVKDDEDSYETMPLLKIILWVCIVAGVLVAVGGAGLFLGIKG